MRHVFHVTKIRAIIFGPFKTNKEAKKLKYLFNDGQDADFQSDYSNAAAADTGGFGQTGFEEEAYSAQGFDAGAPADAGQSPKGGGIVSTILETFNRFLIPILVTLTVVALLFLVWLFLGSGGTNLQSPEVIQTVEKMLASFDINPGRIDGIQDAQFDEAVRTFQEFYGFEQTGQLTVELLQEMEDLAALQQ